MNTDGKMRIDGLENKVAKAWNSHLAETRSHHICSQPAVAPSPTSSAAPSVIFPPIGIVWTRWALQYWHFLVCRLMLSVCIAAPQRPLWKTIIPGLWRQTEKCQPRCESCWLTRPRLVHLVTDMKRRHVKSNFRGALANLNCSPSVNRLQIASAHAWTSRVKIISKAFSLKWPNDMCHQLLEWNLLLAWTLIDTIAKHCLPQFILHNCLTEKDGQKSDIFWSDRD